MTTIQEGDSTVRQQFQIEQPQNQKEPEIITVDKGNACLTFWNFLIMTTSIGLFAYVNTYFLITIAAVDNGQIYFKQTEIFSCNDYFCDQTLYNFVYYFSYYQFCNPAICQNVICSEYTCPSSIPFWPDLNRYYACQPTCGPISNFKLPKIFDVAYGLAIGAAVCFGVGIIIQLVAGIMFSARQKQLTIGEKIGLIFSFCWPGLKYFMFRKRIDWTNFELDLHKVILTDYVVAFLYAITTACYIWFYIAGVWQTSLQIANFFVLLFGTLNFFFTIGASSRALWKAKIRYG